MAARGVVMWIVRTLIAAGFVGGCAAAERPRLRQSNCMDMRDEDQVRWLVEAVVVNTDDD